MNKLQISTTAGIGGLIAAVNKFFGLFGDYTMVNIVEAFKNISIAGFGIAVVGIVVSIYALRYNEEKKGEGS